jgi:putative ATP-dependent endonuclease of OLD family
MDVVDEMVSRKLQEVERGEEYQRALQAIEVLQRPVFDALSASIQTSLQQFLPQVGSVEILSSQEARYSALRRYQIVVDDGTATDLKLKGDGIQSLAAISLIRHLSEELSGDRELILAVEEPEAHLHPKAIQEVRRVLSDIAAKQQVVVTTHSPLLTNRLDVASNILVDRSRARPAKNIKQLREVLGVRVSDNLAMAQLVLVVEGESDAIAMRALLPSSSPALASAIEAGILAVDLLGGASNLAFKLAQLAQALCNYHVFLDHDTAGRAASDRAELEGLLDAARRTYAICLGRADSEFEDLYDRNIYSDMIMNAYTVDITDPGFGSERSRWSARMKKAFIRSGQPWDDKTARQVKVQVAELVAADPESALHPSLRGPFDSVVAALESRIANA